MTAEEDRQLRARFEGLDLPEGTATAVGLWRGQLSELRCFPEWPKVDRWPLLREVVQRMVLVGRLVEHSSRCDRLPPAPYLWAVIQLRPIVYELAAVSLLAARDWLESALNRAADVEAEVDRLVDETLIDEPLAALARAGA